jgi:hypothetical protein
MNRARAQHLVEQQMMGWNAEPSVILETLTPDCVNIESHGPTYRDRSPLKEESLLDLNDQEDSLADKLRNQTIACQMTYGA